jgi:hypothetical protein
MTFAQNAKPTFSMVRPQAPRGGTLEVINGKPATPSEWPATFILRDGKVPCTSTAIGDRVILSAAHCIENNSVGEISISQNQKFLIRCERHPAYNPIVATGKDNFSKDFALCWTEKPMTGFPVERVSSSFQDTRVGAKIRLLGYGCTQSGGFDEKFGVLYSGQAKVTRVPASKDDIHMITVGDAVICYGDSGGGAYADPDRRNGRSLIGVNSRTDAITNSWISSTATDAFMNWAMDWSQNKHVQICGLSEGNSRCR